MIYVVLAGKYEDIMVWEIVTEDLTLLFTEGNGRRKEPYTLCDPN